MLGAGGFTAAGSGLGQLLVQVIDQRAHGGGVGLKVGRSGVEFGFQEAHAVLSSCRPSWSFIASRILNFWILPVTVIGNSLTKRM